MFNEQEGTPTPVIWGCSTTANEWKFLKLEGNTLYIDTTSYSVNAIGMLLGAFGAIFEMIGKV